MHTVLDSKNSLVSKKSNASAIDNALRNLAFNNSFQANIISTVSTGKIVVANSAACKLLGYSKRELLTKKKSAIFDIHETNFKKMMKERNSETHSTAMVTVIKKSGTQIPCEVTSAVFVDKDGVTKSITTIADMSKGILKQKNIDIRKEKVVAHNIILAKSKQKTIAAKKEKIVSGLLTACNEKFKLIFNSSSDVLYDCDLIKNEVIISEAYEKEFGYKTTDCMSIEDCWISHIYSDDKKSVVQDYKRMLISEETEWECNYRFLKADDSVANIFSKNIILRNNDGAFRMLGSMHDVSKQTVLEGILEDEIKLKEKQIADAMKDAKEAERSDIGKELHDNVNQLLGASKLYLDMAKRGGKNSEMYLNRSSGYTLAAIEEIRKLTKGLTTDIIKNFGLCEAINNLAEDTMEVHPIKISCMLNSFIERSVSDKFKLNVFRIVQEQLNNILKHAHATEVTIQLSQNLKTIILSMSDNGVGFDTGKQSKGIGLANIKSRAKSYKGQADFVSEPRRGCVLIVTFPFSEDLTKKG